MNNDHKFALAMSKLKKMAQRLSIFNMSDFFLIVEEPFKYVSICSLRKHEEFGGTPVSKKVICFTFGSQLSVINT